MNSQKLPSPQVDPSSQKSAILELTNSVRRECALVYSATSGQLFRLFRLAVGTKDALALKAELRAAYQSLGRKLNSLALGEVSLRSELGAINQSIARFQAEHDDAKQQQLRQLQAKQADLHVRLAVDYLSKNPPATADVQDEVSVVRRLTKAVRDHGETMLQNKSAMFASSVATNVRAGLGLASIALLGLLIFKGVLPKRSLPPYATRISSQQAREMDFEGIMQAERQRAEREREEKAESRKKAEQNKFAQIKAIVRHGDKLRDAGKLQDAVSTYRSAFEIDPNSAFAFDGQGQVMMLLEQWRDAIPFFDKANQKDRALPGPVLNRARCYIVLGDYRRAVSDLNLAIQLEPMNAEAFSLRAHAHRELKDSASALRDVETALKIDNRLADPYFNRGCILSANPDTAEDAIGNFTIAVRNDPKHAMSYFLRGTMFLKQKEVEKAILDFSSAIEADKNLVDAHSSRAFACAMVGNHLQAVKDFTTVLQQTSEGDAAAGLLLARGESFNVLKEFAKAEEDFGRVLKLKPKSVEALQSRIVARQGLGDSMGAEDDTKLIASLTHTKAPSFSMFRGMSDLQPMAGGYANSGNSEFYMQRAIRQAQDESQQAMSRIRTQRAGRLAAMGVYLD